jgi:hypothetical protein
MRTPTWEEIEEFCRKDGWEFIRSTNHSFFQKVLPDGSVLETHRSFASDKTMSPGRFQAVLHNQLRVTAEAFWETLRTGHPALRSELPRESAPLPIPTWIGGVLLNDLHVTEAQVAKLTPDEARHLVEELWSRPPGPSAETPKEERT